LVAIFGKCTLPKDDRLLTFLPSILPSFLPFSLSGTSIMFAVH
jgi:hypothetical protein